MKQKIRKGNINKYYYIINIINRKNKSKNVKSENNLFQNCSQHFFLSSVLKPMYFFIQSDCLTSFILINTANDLCNEENIYFYYLNLELIY